MGSKSKTTSKQNSTTTSAPPSWALPQMQAIAGGIMNGLGQIGQVPSYTGDFVAQPGQLQLGVPGAYMDAAALAKSLVDPAMGALDASKIMPTYGISDGQLQAAIQGFAANNPGGMDAAIMAATKPVYQQLTEQLLPSLQSAGIESGAYGGTRALYALPEAVIRDSNASMLDIAAQMRYKDFVDSQNRAMEAYGLSTQRGLGEANVLTDRLGLTPDLLDAIMRMGGGSAELQAAAAGYDTQNSQAAIDNALQKYQYSIQQPFMG